MEKEKQYIRRGFNMLESLSFIHDIASEKLIVDYFPNVSLSENIA